MKEASGSITKLLFIAGTHGNEGYSIPLLQKLEKEYPKENWGYDWIVGNPRALAQGVRMTEMDLNRVAPGDPNSPIYEKRRAAEIIDIAKGYDMVIDIHGTDARDTMTKIIPYPSVQNLALAALFPDLINIIWYSSRSMQQGPPVQFMGKPAIELECAKNSPEVADRLYNSLVLALNLKQAASWTTMLNNLSIQDWYQVVGKLEALDPGMREMKPFDTPEGKRYPFLTSTYRKPAAYVLAKIDPTAMFINE